MYGGPVAETHPIRQDRRETGVGVQAAQILDVAFLGDLDALLIAAQHRAVPDTGRPPDVDLTHYGGPGSHVSFGMYVRHGLAERSYVVHDLYDVME
jgi:hypothetical protein